MTAPETADQMAERLKTAVGGVLLVLADDGAKYATPEAIDAASVLVDWAKHRIAARRIVEARKAGEGDP